MSDAFFEKIRARNHSPWWLEMKAGIRRQVCDLCEFCCLRPVECFHHRWYPDPGAEKPEDLIAVCEPCHAFIEGRASEVVVGAGSLAARGDRGFDANRPIWQDYLARGRKPVRPAAGDVYLLRQDWSLVPHSDSGGLRRFAQRDHPPG